MSRRARVCASALSALTMAEYFPRPDRCRHAAVRGQHLPLLAGRQRSLGTAGPHAVGRRLSAHIRPRKWASCRNESRRRSRGPLPRFRRCTCPADDLTDPAPATTFTHLDAFIVLERCDYREGHISRHRPVGLQFAHSRPRRRGRASTTRSPGACRRYSSATASFRTSSLSSACRGAQRRGQAGRRARPQDRALPVAAVLCRRAIHRVPRQLHEEGRHACAASRSCARASGITCPSRRSCTWARSKKPPPRPSG